jgi:hypothetical protein
MDQFINTFQGFMAQLGISQLLIGLFAGLMFISTFLIFFYLAMAIGLYRMALRKEEPNAWIAFIPFVQFYMIGQLLESVKIGNTEISKPNLSYLFVAIVLAPFILGEIPIIGGLLVIFSLIAWFVGFHYLFNRYSRFDVVLTVLNVLTLGLASAFIVLAISSNEQIREPIE